MDERRTTKVTVAYPTPKGSEKSIEVRTYEVPLVLDQEKGRHTADMKALEKKLLEEGFEKVVDISKCYEANPLSVTNAIFVRGADGKPVTVDVPVTDRSGKPVMDKDGKPMMQTSFAKLPIDAFSISKSTFPGSTAYPGIKKELTDNAALGNGKAVRELYAKNRDKLGKSMGILEDGRFYMDHTDSEGKFHPLSAMFPLSLYLRNNLDEGAHRSFTAKDGTEKPSRYEKLCSALGAECGVDRRIAIVNPYNEGDFTREIASASYAALLAKIISEGEAMENLACRKVVAPTLAEASNGYVIKGPNWVEDIALDPLKVEKEVERIENRPVKLSFVYPKDLGKKRIPEGAVLLSMMSKELRDPDGKIIPKIADADFYSGQYNESPEAYLARTAERPTEQILYDIVSSARSTNVMVVGYGNQNDLCRRLVSGMDTNGITIDDVNRARGNTAIVACREQLSPERAGKLVDFLVGEKKHDMLIIPDIEQNENLINAALSRKEDGGKFELVVRGMYAGKLMDDNTLTTRLRATGSMYDPVSMFPTGRAEADAEAFVSGVFDKAKGMTTVYDGDGRFAKEAARQDNGAVIGELLDFGPENTGRVLSPEEQEKANSIADNILTESQEGIAMGDQRSTEEQIVFGRPAGMEEYENDPPFGL